MSGVSWFGYEVTEIKYDINDKNIYPHKSTWKFKNHIGQLNSVPLIFYVDVGLTS